MLPPLLADLPPGTGLHLLASLAVGASVGIVVWWVFQVLQSEELQQQDEWRYDVSRINELRRCDATYRTFQPVIQLLARANRRAFRDSLPEVQRQIQASGLPRFWLAEEYLGKLQLQAVFLLPVYVYLLFGTFGWFGFAMAVVLVGATAWFLRRRLAARAAARLRHIKRRMPFFLDLLTLLMEAGATFMNALVQAVDEFRGHAVAEEFGRVLGDMRLGKTRTDAFSAMRERLADEEIGSILSSILQGEALGTPLAQVFRTQADVLRLKRTQRAETIAGEAGVNMLLPAMLVMMATVLVILGPFLLNYLYVGLML